MLVIKRYPNRKLYDTNAKKYITLDGISSLIRSGEEVQVLDHNTGEDLTAVILTQIIFEQEKKQGGFLPRSVLRGLVEAGGETVSSLRKTLASPLGVIQHVDDEIRRRVNNLVGAGEIDEAAGETLIAKLVSQGTKAADNLLPGQEDLQDRLSKLGIPTRKDLQEITSQLEAIETTLEDLTKQPAPKSKKKKA